MDDIPLFLSTESLIRLRMNAGGVPNTCKSNDETARAT